MHVLEELKNLAEDDYKKFNEKIIPTTQTRLGVRLPALRNIAKRIVREKDVFDFIDSDKQNIFELILLEGMVLSYLDKPFTELVPYTERFLEKVDNWAQIDTTIGDYKNIAREKKEILTIIKKWLDSDKEFTVRAGLVMLLAHYVEKQNLQLIFELSQKVSHPGYYVHMANGWLISVCMVKFPVETIAFLQNNALADKTHNLAIQKSRESRRVSQEHKALINSLKRKQAKT